MFSIVLKRDNKNLEFTEELQKVKISTDFSNLNHDFFHSALQSVSFVH
jgi:hypothetical protein